MLVHGLLGKAAGTVVTGLVGVSAYEVVRKALAKAPLHDAAVTATEWGLRGTRRAEEAAESARLKMADVVAEARERIGEEPQPPPPGNHDPEHGHAVHCGRAGREASPCPLGAFEFPARGRGRRVG